MQRQERIEKTVTKILEQQKDMTIMMKSVLQILQKQEKCSIEEYKVGPHMPA